MDIQCSQCQGLMSIGPEMAGQHVTCPHCGVVLQAPAPAGETATANVRLPGAHPGIAGMGTGLVQLPQKKGMPGVLKALLWCGGLVLVLAVVGLVFWKKDAQLRDYGIAQIESLKLPADQKLVYRAIANHYHLQAANSGTRVTKKSTGTPSKEEYWRALNGLVEAELAKLPKALKYDEVKGNTYLWRDGGARYLLKLSEDGKFERSKYWDERFADAVETEQGSWSAESRRLKLNAQGGGNSDYEILRMGKEGFVLKDGGGMPSYWKLRPQG